MEALRPLINSTMILLGAALQKSFTERLPPKAFNMEARARPARYAKCQVVVYRASPPPISVKKKKKIKHKIRMSRSRQEEMGEPWYSHWFINLFHSERSSGSKKQHSNVIITQAQDSCPKHRKIRRGSQKASPCVSFQWLSHSLLHRIYRHVVIVTADR